MHWPQAIDIQKLAIGENSKGPDSPRAIVILGGGVRHGALDTPEYLQQDVSKETIERLRLGVGLAKKTHLPLLVTGGAPDAYQKGLQSEGELMSEVLLEEFGIKPRWVENQSRTTEENAKFSAAILKEQNINSVYLVTHFWHMRRSQEIFHKYGFQLPPFLVVFIIKIGLLIMICHQSIFYQAVQDLQESGKSGMS